MKDFINFSLIAVIGAILYTIGWFYIEYYLTYFGIGISSIDISKEYFLLYGLRLLLGDVIFWTAIFSLLLLFIISSIYLKLNLQFLASVIKWRGNHYLVFFIIIVYLIYLLSYLPKSEADNDYNSLFEPNGLIGFPRVIVEMKDNKNPRLLEGCFRLLFSSGKSIYLIPSIFLPRDKFSPIITEIPVDKINKIHRILPLENKSDNDQEDKSNQGFDCV